MVTTGANWWATSTLSIHLIPTTVTQRCYSRPNPTIIKCPKTSSSFFQNVFPPGIMCQHHHICSINLQIPMDQGNIFEVYITCSHKGAALIIGVGFHGTKWMDSHCRLASIVYSHQLLCVQTQNHCFGHLDHTTLVQADISIPTGREGYMLTSYCGKDILIGWIYKYLRVPWEFMFFHGYVSLLYYRSSPPPLAGRGLNTSIKTFTCSRSQKRRYR